jgi:hypothetical protein
MILVILEILMFSSGLFMLIVGKTIGHDPVKHWQVRLLGLVLVCEFPVVLLLTLIVAIAAFIADPVAAKAGHLPTWALITGTVIEWGVYFIFAWVWSFWTRRLRAKFAPPPAVVTAPAAPPEGPLATEGDKTDEADEAEYADDEGEFDGDESFDEPEMEPPPAKR